jgi:hypothetical protein
MSSLTIEGFEELQDQIDEFKAEVLEAQKRTPEAVDKGANQTAKLLQSEMRENILRLDAYDTGQLFESVEWTQIESGVYTVGPTAEHAVYVEYGTGIYAERGGGDPITPTEMQALHFETQDGTEVTVASVKGMKPRSFFRSAVNKAEEEGWLAEQAIEQVEEMFQEVFN